MTPALDIRVVNVRDLAPLASSTEKTGKLTGSLARSVHAR